MYNFGRKDTFHSIYSGEEWGSSRDHTVHISKTDINKASSWFLFVILSQSGCSFIRDARVSFCEKSQCRHYESMEKDCNHLKVGLEGGKSLALLLGIFSLPSFTREDISNHGHLLYGTHLVPLYRGQATKLMACCFPSLSYSSQRLLNVEPFAFPSACVM